MLELSDGAEGVAVLREAVALLEAGETVDALVTDLSMPQMDGVTTIQEARAVRPRLLCFLLTGYAGERGALEAGNTFTMICKPVSAQVLAARIEAEQSPQIQQMNSLLTEWAIPAPATTGAAPRRRTARRGRRTPGRPPSRPR